MKKKKREFRDKLSLRYLPCFALITFPNIAAVQQIKNEVNYKLSNTNLHNPGKIPQIEDVVRFGRRGQKAGDSLSVDLGNGTDHNLKG